MEAMRSEFERFQCVTDDPWAVRWRELLQWHRADDGFRDVGNSVVVIATLAKSPIDYAITRLLFERRYFALRQANESAVEARLKQLVHYYTAHEAALRAAAAAGRAVGAAAAAGGWAVGGEVGEGHLDGLALLLGRLCGGAEGGEEFFVVAFLLEGLAEAGEGALGAEGGLGLILLGLEVGAGGGRRESVSALR